jgi:precorrin-2 dehydrogenase/sirohydrochlorin ferrochelatase
MLPLVLDLARLRLVLVGNDARAERRLALLEAAGAADLAVYAEAPSPALALAAGARLVRRLPTTAELVAAHIVFIGDRNAAESGRFAEAARAGGALVHVEDEPALSDVHAPAVLRRGDLLIAISTGGKSPGLARRIKGFLGTLFGGAWEGRLDELALLRRRWRDSGADAATVAQWTAAWVAHQGWLPADDPLSAAAPSAGAARPRPATRH